MKNKKVKYIISFILFFAIGGLLGAFGTYKSLALKDVDEEEVVEEVITEEEILKNPDYTELINNLYNYLGKDTLFYNSLGVDVNTMDNQDKLRIVYTYIINNNLYETESLSPIYYGALTCANNFNLDVIVSADGAMSNGSSCTIYKMSQDLVIETYKKIFNSDSIDANVNFNPLSTKLCMVIDGVYNCGNVNNTTGVTGKLESKFEMISVIKKEKEIVIYDKGYLVDTRSTVVNPDDGHDNYYLHTSDSNMYYYELKSADNITFAHSYILGEDGNYRYNGTSVVQS